ncbi:phytanoyl-CoA dioxygenase family protein [Armatimonas sp.]|uniref:phytanoyl-CoA dioxygenase family protein n=1 Tax=Armatimonas sp. TaxID=1872638 RepID=UPI003750682D
MRNELSGAQIASYRENGFLVIENFLDANELAHWQNTTQEAVDQRLAMTAAGVKSTETNRILSNQQNPDSYYAQVFTQCIKLLETHAGMKELMLDPRLGELAATLAGIEGIRIWHDQALFKPPFGNPTGWHLDNPYWSFSTRDTLSLWVALDDATLGNGCMWYIPGSHKTATWENSGIGQNMSDLFKVYPQWREIEPVACPCPAGSAVFHNGLTAHGAGANMTNKPRRAMTCGYLPDGSVFNGTQNILPDDYFHSLKIGDLLNNDALNPLVWKKPG